MDGKLNAQQKYTQHLHHLLDQVEKTQSDALHKASRLIAQAIENHHALFVFGASHAGILSMELFYRSGGLVMANPIFAPDLMLDARPVTLTTDMERLEGYGNILLNQSKIKNEDILILHSVSGRNAVSIDMALEAKKRGISVIVITNVGYSAQLSSRHASGLKLMDTADVLIDNCGDFEDSSIEIEGTSQKMGPTSTVIGAYIVNSLAMLCAEELIRKGIEVPIYHSANMEGGDVFNETLMRRYADLIHYL